VRPLNLGETLDASIKIVRARWRVLAVVMVAIALPIQIANVLIISSTTDVYQAGSSGLTGSGSSGTTYSDEGAYVAGQTLKLALGILGYLLGTVACYRAIADTYLGRETNARESLSYAGNRLGATLWLTIVMIVGLIAGFIALVIPGIWLAIAWSLAYPVMLVEGTGGVAALRRSFALTSGRWWATLGRLLVAYILVTVLTTVVTLVFLLPAELLIDDTSFGALVLESAASFLVSLLTTPFIAAVATLVYFDLRVRKEGFDLALLAERMGGAPAAEPPPPAGWGGRGGRGGSDERDAFGNPVVRPPAPAPVPDRGATAAAPPGWAPPPAADSDSGSAAPGSGSSAPPSPPAWGAPPPAAAPDSPPAPGSWAPPVPPEPQRRPPSQDE
jgi:hypothetical protein